MLDFGMYLFNTDYIYIFFSFYLPLSWNASLIVRFPIFFNFHLESKVKSTEIALIQNVKYSTFTKYSK